MGASAVRAMFAGRSAASEVVSLLTAEVRAADFFSLLFGASSRTESTADFREARDGSIELAAAGCAAADCSTVLLAATSACVPASRPGLAWLAFTSPVGSPLSLEVDSSVACVADASVTFCGFASLDLASALAASAGNSASVGVVSA